MGWWDGWEENACFWITEFLFLQLEMLGWHRTLTSVWIFMGTIKSLACTDRSRSVFLMAIISQVLIMLCGCIWSTWHLRSKNNYGRYRRSSISDLHREKDSFFPSDFPRKTPQSICLDYISQTVLCSKILHITKADGLYIKKKLVDVVGIMCVQSEIIFSCN